MLTIMQEGLELLIKNADGTFSPVAMLTIMQEGLETTTKATTQV